MPEEIKILLFAAALLGVPILVGALFSSWRMIFAAMAGLGLALRDPYAILMAFGLAAGSQAARRRWGHGYVSFACISTAVALAIVLGFAGMPIVERQFAALTANRQAAQAREAQARQFDEDLASLSTNGFAAGFGRGVKAIAERSEPNPRAVLLSTGLFVCAKACQSSPECLVYDYNREYRVCKTFDFVPRITREGGEASVSDQVRTPK